MKLFYEYIVIFFNLSPTSNHLYPLQAENCDSNSWLVVDKDDNAKFRLERVKAQNYLDLPEWQSLRLHPPHIDSATEIH